MPKSKQPAVRSAGILVDAIKRSLPLPELNEVRKQFSVDLMNGVEEKFLCQGDFGPISSATVYGLPNIGGPVEVTVKRVTEQLQGDRQKEAHGWLVEEGRALLAVNSPFVMGVVGVGVTDHDSVECLLLRHFEHGDLRSYLLSHAGDPSNGHPHSVSVSRRAEMALDAVRGVAYLSGIGVVLRDLGTRSFLLDSSGSVCVGDLGAARRFRTEDYWVKNATTDGVALPLRWLPPEVIGVVAKDPTLWADPSKSSTLRQAFGPQTDVYSFGITLWEIATCAGLPFRPHPEAKVVALAKKAALKLSDAGDFPPKMRALIASCTSHNPACRPEFPHVESEVLDLKWEVELAAAAADSEGGEEGTRPARLSAPGVLCSSGPTQPLSGHVGKGSPLTGRKPLPHSAGASPVVPRRGDGGGDGGSGGVGVGVSSSPGVPRKEAGRSETPGRKGTKESPKPPPRFTRTTPPSARKADNIAGTDVNAHTFISDSMLDALVQNLDEVSAAVVARSDSDSSQSDPESPHPERRVGGVGAQRIAVTAGDGRQASSPQAPPPPGSGGAGANKERRSNVRRCSTLPPDAVLANEGNGGGGGGDPGTDDDGLEFDATLSRPSSAPLARPAHPPRKSPRLWGRGARKTESKLKAAALKGHYDVVCELLSVWAGRIDVNAVRSGGSQRTPLYCAAQGGHDAIVAKLLEAGADPMIPARNGYRPYDVAQDKGFTKVLKLLAAAMGPDAGDSQRRTSNSSGMGGSSDFGGSTDSLLDTSSEFAEGTFTAAAGGGSGDGAATGVLSTETFRPRAVTTPGLMMAAASKAAVHSEGPDDFPPSPAISEPDGRVGSGVGGGVVLRNRRPSIDPLLIDSISSAYKAALEDAESTAAAAAAPPPMSKADRRLSRENILELERGPPPRYSTVPTYEPAPEGDMYGVVLSATEAMAQDVRIPSPRKEADGAATYGTVTNTAVDHAALAAARQLNDEKIKRRGDKTGHDAAATRETMWSPPPVEEEGVEEWLPPEVLGDDIAEKANRAAEEMYAALPTQ